MHSDVPSTSGSQAPRTYDVAICGGGLAGLTLARQLKLKNADLSVIVLERLRRPLPEAAFKVGEASVEIGAYYCGTLLQLEDYLIEHHLEKLGLRFFYRAASGDFADRPEFGVGDWLPAHSFQLDRGKLENDLRQIVADQAVELREGVAVQDVILHPASHPHEVLFVDEEGRRQSVSARWIVDATGRRRLIQKKLGLAKKSRRVCNAVWWRIEGELNVDSFVPASNEAWHARVRQSRWYSTNHLMGDGYWVWIIPLSSNHTSIGIVTADECHPFSHYGTYERAMAWLRVKEPTLAGALDGYPVVDFKTMRDYSYSSHQVYSTERWTCVGEAGAFVDPYYSVGLNMIAFGNSITVKLIEDDLKGALDASYVERANRFYLSLVESLSENIQYAYPFYYHPQVMSLKTMWDFHIGWGIADPQLYHGLYLDATIIDAISQLIARTVVTQSRIMNVFRDWARTPPDQFSFEFDYIDYIDHLPSLKSLFVRNLPNGSKPLHGVLRDLRQNIDRIEELAQVIFFLAVEETMPEELHRFEDRRWVNTAALSLDPTRWEADGLFRPITKSRDLSVIDAEIRRVYRLKGQEQGERRRATAYAASV